jgi:hypothetical protein
LGLSTRLIAARDTVNLTDSRSNDVKDRWGDMIWGLPAYQNNPVSLENPMTIPTYYTYIGLFFGVSTELLLNIMEIMIGEGTRKDGEEASCVGSCKLRRPVRMIVTIPNFKNRAQNWERTFKANGK